MFLVRRSRDASLMAGMWELPEIPTPENHAKPALTMRHSITVTDYTVKVWRHPFLDDSAGERIAVGRLGNVALTGLARKILRKIQNFDGSQICNKLSR